jgi:hypothetical protein
VGYSISWLAVHAGAAETLAALALHPTGEQLELPEAPFVGALLSTGWYLVVADRCDHALVAEATLKSLPASTDAVSCSIEEHVMFSAASFWSGGRRVWSVSHDAQKAIDHLESWGDLPPFYSEIREAILAQQAREGGAGAEVDFVSDLPLELARRIVGYKHDADGEPARFDVLHPTSDSLLARRKPWGRFW